MVEDNFSKIKPGIVFVLSKLSVQLNIYLNYINKCRTLPTDYTLEVYEAVAEMFASNVFRPLPPSSYSRATDDEMVATVIGLSGGGVVVVDDSEALAFAEEHQQTAMAYEAFKAFLGHSRFDVLKADRVLDRRFANGLVHRLNSGDPEERQTVCDLLAQVRDVCPPSVRDRVLDAAVAELADFAYGYAPRHPGVGELLEFIANTIDDCCDRPVAVEKVLW